MRMISSVAGLVTSLLLLFAVPALAANNNSSNGSNNGGNQDRLLRSAERACRQTAQNKGYDVRDVTGSRYTGNDTARVSLRLRRKNQSFDGRCSYDGRADKASLDVQGSGDSGSGDRRLLQSAERACRQTAQNRGYEVRDITGSKATGDRTARVDLRLRRKDRSYDGRCSYDSRDDRASLDVQQGSGNGGDHGGSSRGNLEKRAKSACWAGAYARNEKLTGFDQLEPDGRNYKVKVSTWRDSNSYRYWCFYDPRTDTAELRPRH